MALTLLADQTTKSAAVLSNPMFCGDTGKRTIFTIALTQGQVRSPLPLFRLRKSLNTGCLRRRATSRATR